MSIIGVVGPLRGFEWMKKGVGDGLRDWGGGAEIWKDGKRNGYGEERSGRRGKEIEQKWVSLE